MATVVIYEQQVLMNRVTLEAPFQTKCITLGSQQDTDGSLKQ